MTMVLTTQKILQSDDPAPQRIQLRRTKGWRKPQGAIVVSRPSKWGNPISVQEFGRAEAIRLYREWKSDRHSPATTWLAGVCSTSHATPTCS
jgi:hypothetical protein